MCWQFCVLLLFSESSYHDTPLGKRFKKIHIFVGPFRSTKSWISVKLNLRDILWNFLLLRQNIPYVFIFTQSEAGPTSDHALLWDVPGDSTAPGPWERSAGEAPARWTLERAFLVRRSFSCGVSRGAKWWGHAFGCWFPEEAWLETDQRTAWNGACDHFATSFVAHSN